jgi:hypothetical protein
MELKVKPDVYVAKLLAEEKEGSVLIVDDADIKAVKVLTAAEQEVPHTPSSMSRFGRLFTLDFTLTVSLPSFAPLHYPLFTLGCRPCRGGEADQGAQRRRRPRPCPWGHDERHPGDEGNTASQVCKLFLKLML